MEKEDLEWFTEQLEKTSEAFCDIIKGNSDAFDAVTTAILAVLDKMNELLRMQQTLKLLLEVLIQKGGTK